MSSTQSPLKSKPSTKLPLKCQQWMNDLWKDLNAKAEAGDRHINKTHTKVLGKHTGRIQRKLREKLSEKACSLTRLVENRPGLRRRAVVYKERAIKVRTKALDTISEEEHTINPKLPKMPRLSEKKSLRSWVKETIQVYGQYIVSDSVDASIKPRIKQIRQSLWSYRETGKGIGKMIAKGRHGPSRSDCQCFSTEVAVMLGITSKITKYQQLLDRSLIDVSFRPRVLEIVGTLKSCKENEFLNGLDMTIFNQFEKEIQDHLKART